MEHIYRPDHMIVLVHSADHPKASLGKSSKRKLLARLFYLSPNRNNSGKARERSGFVILLFFGSINVMSGEYTAIVEVG
jgi:hypothetical protein